MFVYLVKPLIMHKDKRKKRISRKAKKRHKHIIWFKKQLPYLQAELPKMLVRDYYKEENSLFYKQVAFLHNN
jgi:hypothetical protein